MPDFREDAKHLNAFRKSAGEHCEPVGRKIHIYEKEHENDKKVTGFIFSCAYEYKFIRSGCEW